MIELESDGAPGTAAGGRADRPAHPDHAPRFAHYENAAREAVMAHPLYGEDLETTYLEDAQMWLRVYQELLDFKETLLRDMNAALSTMPEVARVEIETSDAVILEAEAQRFRQRLAWWEARCEALTPRS
ncbi:MAG: hypothetical protein JF887_07105 [Candidatus Dormibacteraeota bacterium]|uniref:Uncharacterized protein n=1 Tax=Candidatus Amunia macphersoniae TaxID=3127014 RepID=A0A934NGE1_9BACT|nr:hypothetical protein [Candidatus Dormibacteraeota bacterium]